jgi:hypothetical protein
MTRRYIHPQEEKLRDAAKGIDDVFNSQKTEKGKKIDTK